MARKGFADQLEQVFTISLLADLAIPVLLDSWSDYYLPVFPFFLAVRTWLGFDKHELIDVREEVGIAMADVFSLFDLPDQAATDCLVLMAEVVVGWSESEDA